MFYLGRVEEVQEQLAWGSAKVYLEIVWSPSFPLRILLGGGGWRRWKGCWLHISPHS